MEGVRKDSGSRRQDELCLLMEKAARHQITDCPLDPVALRKCRRGNASGHFTDQLVLRQNLRVNREDLSEDAGLVAVVFFGGGRGALIVCATRLVVHREFRLLVPCPRLLAQRGGAFSVVATL